MTKKIFCVLALVTISGAAVARPLVRYNPRGPVGGPGYGNHWGDNDNNPPGRAGGRGTNWENRPGWRGGPEPAPIALAGDVSPFSKRQTLTCTRS